MAATEIESQNQRKLGKSKNEERCKSLREKTKKEAVPPWAKREKAEKSHIPWQRLTLQSTALLLGQFAENPSRKIIKDSIADDINSTN